MEFHTPGRPEDLLAFDTLWARAATLAALHAGGLATMYEYGEAVVEYDDGGGNEWRLTPVEGGRGVLVGVDLECDAHTRIGGFDPYSGPEWLPWDWFTELQQNREQGFAYWWDGTSWNRVAYPDSIDNDGLDLLEDLCTPERVVDEVLNACYLFHDQVRNEAVDRDCAARVRRLLELAEQHTGNRTEWYQALDELLLGVERLESNFSTLRDGERTTAAALAVAQAAGLVSGSSAESKPAGDGRPAGWTPHPRRRTTLRSLLWPFKASG